MPSPSVVNKPPVFTRSPSYQNATVGSKVTFTSVATGLPAPTFQWKKNYVDIAGATDSSYTIANVAPSDSATYSVTAKNSMGSAYSTGAYLSVVLASAPYFTTFPRTQTVKEGSIADFEVLVYGNPAPTLQWQRNGVNLPGAISGSYQITSATVGDAGSYTVVATNSEGSVTSPAALLNVTTETTISNKTYATRQTTTETGPDSIITNPSGTGTVTVSSGATVIFQAATSIKLEPTTIIRAGSNFHALINPTIAQLPVITSAATASVTRGRPFNYQITAYNTPSTYGATGMPTGLNVRASGLIEGAPVTAGTYYIVLTTGNAAGSYATTLILTVY